MNGISRRFAARVGRVPTTIELEFCTSSLHLDPSESPLFITFVFETGQRWEIPKSLLLEGIANGSSGLLDVRITSDLSSTTITLDNGQESANIYIMTGPLRAFVRACYKIQDDSIDIDEWIAELLSKSWKARWLETRNGVMRQE